MNSILLRKMTTSINQINKETWDRFVEKNDGSIYHLYDWAEVFEEAFGYKTNYVVFLKQKRIIAVLPGVYRGKLNKTFVSLPFVDYAGVVPTNRLLLQKAIRSNFVQKEPYEIYSEVKNNHNVVYQTYELDTTPGYTELNTRIFHHKTRNMVKKSNNGLISGGMLSLSHSSIKNFYKLYATTMRKIGTLAPPLIFFEAINKRFGPRIKVFVASVGHRPASYLWCFILADQMYVFANASDQKLLPLGTNYFVYDQAIQYACKNKIKKLSLGASAADTPQSFFKKRWGAIEKPIYLYSDKYSSPTNRWLLLSLVRPFIRLLPLSLYFFVCQVAFWLS